jgi:hypothetical protein
MIKIPMKRFDPVSCLLTVIEWGHFFLIATMWFVLDINKAMSSAKHNLKLYFTL